jgi:hypothetical protein
MTACQADWLSIQCTDVDDKHYAGGNVTELNFKGKEFVYNHHLAVPFRPLVPDAVKGIGPVALDGNLVIHGDNLHALKALLPTMPAKSTAFSSIHLITRAMKAGATTTM